jgi:hypothetical protein
MSVLPSFICNYVLVSVRNLYETEDEHHAGEGIGFSSSLPGFVHLFIKQIFMAILWCANITLGMS